MANDITIPKESFNKAFFPYLYSTAREEYMFGGGGSGKSYFLAQRDLIELMGKKNNNILIMRKVAASNHNSTFADFKNVLNNWDNDFRKQDSQKGKYRSDNLISYFKINNSKGDERIVFTPTGNEILFGIVRQDKFNLNNFVLFLEFDCCLCKFCERTFHGVHRIKINFTIAT